MLAKRVMPPKDQRPPKALGRKDCGKTHFRTIESASGLRQNAPHQKSDRYRNLRHHFAHKLAIL